MYLSLHRSVQKCTARGWTAWASAQRDRILTSRRAETRPTFSAASPRIHSCSGFFVFPQVSQTNAIMIPSQFYEAGDAWMQNREVGGAYERSSGLQSWKHSIRLTIASPLFPSRDGGTGGRRGLKISRRLVP